MVGKSFKLASLICALFLVLTSVSFSQTRGGDNMVWEYICAPCGCACDDSLFTSAGNCPCCNMRLLLKSDVRKVAVLIFDGVEVLDFTGPLDVFVAGGGYFNVFTVSPDSLPISTGRGTMRVSATYRLDNCPNPDILVIPGGHVGDMMENEKVLSFIKEKSKTAEVVMSVCSGSFILAEAGLLDGLNATAHESDVDELESIAKTFKVVRGQRYVDNGKIICAGGVSSGIDAALYLIERLHDKELADQTAQYLQHQRRAQ